MGSFLQAVTASATAFVVSGNSGVSPMLTMFAVGVIENVNPDLLNMNGALDALLASPWALAFTGALTVAELVGKCVPVLDEVIDAAMTFMIPVVSVVGTLSTFGLWDLPSSQEMDGDYDEAAEQGADQDGDEQRRRLSVASGMLWIFKSFLLFAGVGLALSMHAVKMLIRLFGEGWATGCLAVSEALWVSFTITLVLFIRPLAIVVGSFIVMVGVFNGARILRKRSEEESGKHDGTDYHQGPDAAMQRTNGAMDQKTSAGKLQQEGFKFTEKVRSENDEESGNTSGTEYHRAIEDEPKDEKPSKLQQSSFKFTEPA